jgi:hypothetical protein
VEPRISTASNGEPEAEAYLEQLREIRRAY